MNRFLILTLAAGWVVALNGAGQQPQVFRSTADVVPLFVTVTDKAGRLVPDLVREDFQIFDNGKPQPLTQFDKSPQEIRLIALVDISGSVAQRGPILARACAELVAHLTRDSVRAGPWPP